jgi:hypothetical protein
MRKPDSLAKTAIMFIKMGKMSWTRGHWRQEKKASAALLAIARSLDSIWSRLFTTSASVAIGSIGRKRRRRVPIFAGDVM